ncbi:MAG: class I tRNA ligase family protein, partial [Dongiaceae bacterium]
LRLWVVSTDYSDDQRIGAEILKHQAEAYRRLRNTLRYLLGALQGWQESERLPAAEMPELDRWVLHRIAELSAKTKETADSFDFHPWFTELHNFCAVDLSAFYFDIRKDALYCDAPTSTTRRAVRTVLYELLNHLTAWLAPVLCFTAEEAWRHRPWRDQSGNGEGNEESVHLRLFPAAPADWRDEALAAKWDKLRDLRRVVTGALELARARKQIGSSLQAKPVVYLTEEQRQLLAGLDLAEIAITSAITLDGGAAPADAFRLPDVEGLAVVVAPAEGEKCERCWRVLPEVGQHHDHPTLCNRCADAVGEAGQEAGKAGVV